LALQEHLLTKLANKST